MQPVGRQGVARRPGFGPAIRHAFPAPVWALFSLPARTLSTPTRRRSCATSVHVMAWPTRRRGAE